MLVLFIFYFKVDRAEQRLAHYKDDVYNSRRWLIVHPIFSRQAQESFNEGKYCRIKIKILRLNNFHPVLFIMRK